MRLFDLFKRNKEKNKKVVKKNDKMSNYIEKLNKLYARCK